MACELLSGKNTGCELCLIWKKGDISMEERIAKAQWSEFFKDFAKTHHGYEACIEILGQDFGDQEEAVWLPLSGISYDPHGDHIIITLGGMSSRYPVHLTHMIAHPTELAMHQPRAEGISSVRVVSPDETETLVHLRRQPQLPSASAS
jgi:hypothetical protein